MKEMAILLKRLFTQIQMNSYMTSNMSWLI